MKQEKLYLYFHGIGDSLIFSTILYYLGKKSGEKFLVGSPHPEIYKGNPYVRHLPVKTHRAAVLWRKILKSVGYINFYEYINYTHEGDVPKKHIINLLCERVNLKDVPERTKIFLTDKEKKNNPLPKSLKPWLGIQSTGNKVTTKNKNWSVEKFQDVANNLKEKYSLVQFGSFDDPPLNVDLNLCGKVSIRESFAALAQCTYFIGQVGFLMHAAASVKVPAVIIYGGFEAPWQSGYNYNINLYNPVPCAPCWIWGDCPNSNVCMKEISSDDVLEAFSKLELKYNR